METFCGANHDGKRISPDTDLLTAVAQSLDDFETSSMM